MPTKSKSIKTDKILLVKALYTYFMMAVAVFLLVSAAVTGTRTLVYSITFDKYPVENSRYFCDYETRPMMIDGEEIEDIKNNSDCEAQLDEERRLRKADDLIRTLAYTLVGTAVLIPHLYMAKAISNERD